MPDNFCESGDGLLYIANGQQAVLRWDGLALNAESAGVEPPLAAPTLAGNGVPGPIVGTYAAYLRYVDQYGNFSDLSPLSNIILPQSSTGDVEDASDETPIVINSPAHGLLTGATVSLTGIGGNTTANNTYTVTVVDGDNFSLDNSSGTGTFTGGGTWVAGVSGIVYSSIPLPVETKVVRRQLLRNTDGQDQTFYVDIDTFDLASTTLTSFNTDADLQAGTAQPLLNPDGTPAANVHGVPPNWKSALQFHLGRMFYAVDGVYSYGAAAVSFGSTTVYGIGTEWTLEMANRAFYADGAQQVYQIASVDPVNQILTLTAVYLSTTNPYAVYTIRPEPAEARLVYYSEAGLPDSVSAANALSVQANGDELTGLMVMSSFLYILERRHIHRFTFQSDPAADGYIFQAASARGCINQRCWVLVDSNAYMLDEQGVHAFSGGEDSDPISLPIQDVFRHADGDWSINWQASQYFHAAHYPNQNTVRWFVALNGSYLPQHALAYNYRFKRWWIEYFATPIGAAALLDFQGERLLYLGTTARRVVAFWTNYLDGVNVEGGTVQGTATAWTPLSLTDANATFGSDLVNAPLAIVDGTGKGQQRLVRSVSGQRLNIDRPWLTLPDATSVYQLGGIYYWFRSRWFRFFHDEEEDMRRIEAVFEPVDRTTNFTWQLTYDVGGLQQMGYSFTEADANGVRSDSGNADLTCDLTKPGGFIQKRLDNRKEMTIDGPRYMYFDTFGWSNGEEITFYSFTVDGVR